MLFSIIYRYTAAGKMQTSSAPPVNTLKAANKKKQFGVFICFCWTSAALECSMMQNNTFDNSTIYHNNFHDINSILSIQRTTYLGLRDERGSGFDKTVDGFHPSFHVNHRSRLDDHTL